MRARIIYLTLIPQPKSPEPLYGTLLAALSPHPAGTHTIRASHSGLSICAICVSWLFVSCVVRMVFFLVCIAILTKTPFSDSMAARRRIYVNISHYLCEIKRQYLFVRLGRKSIDTVRSFPAISRTKLLKIKIGNLRWLCWVDRVRCSVDVVKRAQQERFTSYIR